MSLLAYDRRGSGQKVALIHGLALDAQVWERVVGCSMGGCVAQDFAIHYPQRTDGLVLIDTTAWYGPDAPTAWAERANHAEKNGLPALIPFQVTRVANDLDSYVATCHLLGVADLRDGLATVTKPAAVVVDEHDPATPVAMAEELVKLLDGPPLTVIAGGRHLTPLEAPETIAGVITELLSRVDGEVRG